MFDEERIVFNDDSGEITITESFDFIPKKNIRGFWTSWLADQKKIRTKSDLPQGIFCFACGCKEKKVFRKFAQKPIEGGRNGIENIHLLCADCRDKVRDQEEKTHEEWLRERVVSWTPSQIPSSFERASLKDRVETQPEGGHSFKPQGQGDCPSNLVEAVSQARKFASGARKESTKKEYVADLEDFRAWCEEKGFTWFPATQKAVALYISDRAAELCLSTLERRLAAISVAHKEEGHDNPARKEGELEQIWKGLVREKGRDQDGAPPLFLKDLRDTLKNLPRYSAEDDGPIGRLTLKSFRDRALLLIGWAGALRRSELVALQVQDVDFDEDRGMTLHIRQSKNDQEGEGLTKGIPYGATSGACPVRALKQWLQNVENEVTGSFEGDIFRRFYRGESIAESAISGQSVTDILKEHLKRVNLEAEEYSSHSLRGGFITEAIRKGASERRVKEHSGHDSWEAFNAYVQEAKAFQNNPVQETGL